VRPVFAWFAPDLALVAATVTLFYCLFFFQGYQKLFRDSDAGWHIRTGEAVLATGQLPRTDPYSFTRPGQPWFAWEWGADIAAGTVHKAAGLRGVALFYGVVIAAGVWMWFRLHWVMGGNFLVAGAMSPLLLTTCSIHWLARPHVIGWLFLLGAVLWAEKARGPFGWRGGLGVAVFAAAWANLHASFFFAAVIWGIYAVGKKRVHRGGAEGAEEDAEKTKSKPESAEGAESAEKNHGPISAGVQLGRYTRLRLGTFVWAAVVAAVAPLGNPYGWRLYSHVFGYVTDSELLSRIAEFQSFDFHAAGSGPIMAAVILGIAGGTLAFTQGRFEHALLAALISVLALRSARALPLVALLLLPIANAAITPMLNRGFQAYNERLRAIDARQCGLALAPAIVLAAFALLRLLPAGFPPDVFPVAAYSHIPADARLFAPDKFGGYLIYRSNGTRKVFFDGRSDFYGAEFLRRYSRLVQVRPRWSEYWDSFQFTHALMPGDFPLVPALEQIGWREVYRDGTATLLERGEKEQNSPQRRGGAEDARREGE